MAYYEISPCSNLKGEVKISGSKNSSLPIMAAALLSDGESELYNIPLLSDTENMIKILNSSGAKCQRQENGSLLINPSSVCKSPAGELVSKIRASFLVIGPMLATGGKIRIPLPGGCRIGSRPIDLHLKGFSAMGAKIKQGHGYVELKCDKLHPANIYLDFPSVGATENIMMAAAKTQGTTVIENAANEPEIIDLANFLSKMGAEITGFGTDTIKIKGNRKLKPASHTVIPDRIEAGTFMTIAAMCKGSLKLKNVMCDHLKPVTAKLKEMGIPLTEHKNSIEILPFEKTKAVDIKTLPYPGFPTDMQAQFMSLMSIADGTGVVVETIFENRFMQVPELLRMGAKIKIDGRAAVIDGAKRLSGAEVRATDLRAGASLVIAALSAQGNTRIHDIEHIERGYENFEQKLSDIGVNITKFE